jgi:hypothetical protein
MFALLAVGAWSAELGGRALYFVLAAFVRATAFGGTQFMSVNAQTTALRNQ